MSHCSAQSHKQIRFTSCGLVKGLLHRTSVSYLVTHTKRGFISENKTSGPIPCRHPVWLFPNILKTELKRLCFCVVNDHELLKIHLCHRLRCDSLECLWDLTMKLRQSQFNVVILKNYCVSILFQSIIGPLEMTQPLTTSYERS